MPGARFPQGVAPRVRAAGDTGVDVDAHRWPAHGADEIGANLFDRGPLGAADDVRVHRVERPQDLFDTERPAERRRVGDAAAGDEVLDERHGPVTDGEVRGGFL